MTLSMNEKEAQLLQGVLHALYRHSSTTLTATWVQAVLATCRMMTCS